MTLNRKTYNFKITNKNNYFYYTSPSFIKKSSLKEVTGDDLEKLKKKKYVQKIIKENNLE